VTGHRGPKGGLAIIRRTRAWQVVHLQTGKRIAICANRRDAVAKRDELLLLAKLATVEGTPPMAARLIATGDAAAAWMRQHPAGAE
jgi:hypothetical protein